MSETENITKHKELCSVKFQPMEDKEDGNDNIGIKREVMVKI